MFVTPELFSELKEHYSEIKQSDFIGLNEKVKLIIQNLNKIDGAVVVSWEVPNWNETEPYYDETRSAIIGFVLAITDQASAKTVFDINQKIYKELSHAHFGYYRIIEFKGQRIPTFQLWHNFWDKDQNEFENKLNRYIGSLKIAMESINEIQAQSL